MGKISLRAYDREIEGLVEQGRRLDEAVAHCRHILTTFPKHLDTYRLLGKAYLEAKRYDQAVDIFQRVLVAAPDDFVAHVGMSIISDDRGSLDDAIWHMERAFEVQPSNAAIQGELQRLFGRRDGVEPPRIRLTRGALAHMYVQGELYTQAISEIRAVLSGDPKRTDLQLLLARAYFRSGQKAEAIDSCKQILSKFPYCLDANRIMVESLAGAPNADAAQEYRQRVNELDPYTLSTEQSVFQTDAVPDAAVTLQHLEYTGPVTDAGSAFGIGLEPMEGPDARSAVPPAWLAGAATPPAEEPQPPSAELPDFLREAGWTEVTGDQPAGTASPVEYEPAAVPGDLPEWVKALAPQDASEPVIAVEPTGEAFEPSEDVEGMTEISPAPSVGEAPQAGALDWLAELRSQDVADLGPAEPQPFADAEAPAPEAGASTSAEQLPDWLAGFSRDVEPEAPSTSAGPMQEAGLPPLGMSAREQDDSLAWLEGLASKHGAKPEELITPPEARTDEVPDWIARAGAIADQAPAAAAEAAPVLPDTNAEAVGADEGESTSFGQTDAPSPAPAEQPGSPQFDWLTSLSDQDTFAAMEGETPGEESPIAGDFEAALKGVAPPPERGAEPGWLASENLAFEQPSALGEASDEIDADAGLPDWLADIDKKQAVPAPSSAESAEPAWLEPEAEVTPPVAQSTRPEDWQPAEERESALAAEIPLASPATQARKSGPIPAPPLPGSLSLGGAKTELGRGNIAAALEIYQKFIRKGRSLEEIIRDLRDALYRYPVEVPIWQALGDAYMRLNRLQEALDAYTKAEELLR